MLAEGVGRRTRRVGWGAVVAGAAAWGLLLRYRVFDSWRAALGWSPLLVILLIPGVILLSFARRSGRLARLPEVVATEVGALVGEAREQVAAGIAGVKGRAGLTALVGSLGELREFGDEGRALISQIVGTARLLNPFYLGVAGIAWLAVLPVGLVLAAALITLLF